MLTLYAVTHAGQPPPDTLSVLTRGNAAVLYAQCQTPPRYQRDDIVDFARTLLELDAPAGLLPIRYGTTLEDLEELDELLEANESTWLEQLGRLRDHVEVIVHWEFPVDAVAPRETTGRSYLLDRVQHARRSRDLCEELRTSLADLVADTRLLKGDPARVACLVRRGAVAELEEALGAYAMPRARSISTTGPWPPFSFTDLTTEGAT